MIMHHAELFCQLHGQPGDENIWKDESAGHDDVEHLGCDSAIQHALISSVSEM